MDVWSSGLSTGVSAAAIVVILVIAIGSLRLRRHLRTLRSEAAEARALRSRLDSAHAQVRSLHDQLKGSDLLRARFFANLSHELRTPLSLILGTTETLLRRDSTTLTPSVVTIRKNALLLHKHVDDLLALARSEAREMSLSYARVDVAQLVRDTTVHFDNLAGSRGIALHVEAPATLSGHIDGGKLERILLNLLFNAFKFTPVGGAVTCRVDADAGSDELLITVEDTGPGVPVEARARIFDPFEQAAAPASALFGGTGLGLSISRELARAHGGDIVLDDRAEHEASSGARFVVRLPRSAPSGIEVCDDVERSGEIALRIAHTAATELARLVESDEGSGPSSPGLESSRPRVLIVEDDLDLRRFLKGLLSSRYDAHTAAHSEEAMEVARHAPPDLVLTDVMMPHGGGEELLRRMRADPTLKSVPVVVLTAVGREDTCVRMLESGAVDYVTKPFRISELLARVAIHLSTKRARDALSEIVRDQQTDLDGLAREVADKSRALSRALAEAEVARDLAERAARVKTNFLGMMSHELRTPLSALQLQLRLLEPHEKALARYEVEASDVARAQRCCVRIRDLVDSLLEIARAESGRLTLRVEAMDLVELVASVLRDFETQAEVKKLALKLEPDGVVPTAHTDRALLRLVLVNLVGNAVKYTREGEVRVQVRFSGGCHRFTVHDTGPGIPADKRDAVFEPFLRLEDLRREEGEGSGLGLAIVRDLVRALGGEVHLVAADHGSAFEVSLPPQPAALDTTSPASA